MDYQHAHERMMNRTTIDIMRRGFASVLLFLAVAACAFAQPQKSASQLQVGVHGEGVLATPGADFTDFPGVLNCLEPDEETRFVGGLGGGYMIGAMLALRPSMASGFGAHIGGSVKVGITRGTTRFEAEQQIGRASDPSGNMVPVIDRFTIITRTNELRIEPSASWWLSQEIPLFLSLGGRFSFAYGATYEQFEEITSPEGASFGDGSMERNRMDGDVAGFRALQLGMTAGLGCDIPLGASIALRPELSMLLAFTQPVPNVRWFPHEVRFGLGILYSLPRESSSPLEEE